MTKNVEKEMGTVDERAKKKAKPRLLASYANDTDIQRLSQLKPMLTTEYEESNGVTLSDSEAVRRSIFELWKIKVAKL